MADKNNGQQSGDNADIGNFGDALEAALSGSAGLTSMNDGGDGGAANDGGGNDGGANDGGNDGGDGNPGADDAPDNSGSDDKGQQKQKGAQAPKVPSVNKKPGNQGKDGGDDDAVPAGLDAKAGAKWKELRSESKAARERAEAAEKRAQELEEKLKAFNPDEIAELRKRVEEQESELTVSRVEATREFKQAVTEPTKQVLEAAKSLAKRYDADERAVLAALTESDPDKQSDLLQSLAATWGDRDRTRLYRMGDDLLMLGERKKLLLENASSTLQRIEAKRAEAEKALNEVAAAEYGQALDGVWNGFVQQSPFFDVSAEGVDPAHKAALTKVQEIGRKVDFGKLNPAQKAYAAYAGALVPYLMQVIGGLQGGMEKLETELAGFRGASPGAGAGGSGGGNDGGDDASEGDFGAGLDQVFGN